MGGENDLASQFFPQSNHVVIRGIGHELKLLYFHLERPVHMTMRVNGRIRVDLAGHAKRCKDGIELNSTRRRYLISTLILWTKTRTRLA